MKRFFLLAVCLCISVPAFTHPFERALLRVMRETNSLFRHSIVQKLPKSSLQRSVLLLQEIQPVPGYAPCLMQATAFVIEDNSQGKPQLWGVTASHYRFAKPQLMHLEAPKLLNTQIYAQGGGGVNDVAIFPIPSSLKNKVVPLKLAAHGPTLGQKLHSVSFFDDQIHHETVRQVKEVAPHRVLTTLNVTNPGDRIGACGSPVLNSRNEVVGVHVSSSKKHQTGGVVPVEHIRALLTAYHTHNPMPQPVYFLGNQITSLGINEFIGEIIVFKGPAVLRRTPLLHHNKVIDYDHLEDLVNTAGGATHVVFVIQQQPLLPLEQGHTPHAFFILYNLETGHFEKAQNDSFVPL